jgi:hypothetical protein
MYKRLRDIHLVLGLFALPFALVYGLSAAQMAHPSVLHARTETRVWNAVLPAGQAAQTPEAALHALELQEHVGGELKKVSHAGDLLVLHVERPGTAYEVELRAGRYAKISEKRGNTLQLMNRLHHAAGVGGTRPASRLWGWLVVLVSLALLGLGVTGIWMWLSRKSERRAGLVFLVTSTAYALGLLLAIRFA